MYNGTIPLRELRAGQSAHISRLTGRPEQIHRLEEFGFRGGTCIEMFRPGNPCILRMGGSKVCFRAEELLDIFVVPVSD